MSRYRRAWRGDSSRIPSARWEGYPETSLLGNSGWIHSIRFIKSSSESNLGWISEHGWGSTNTPGDVRNHANTKLKGCRGPYVRQQPLRGNQTLFGVTADDCIGDSCSGRRDPGFCLPANGVHNPFTDSGNTWMRIHSIRYNLYAPTSQA